MILSLIGLAGQVYLGGPPIDEGCFLTGAFNGVAPGFSRYVGRTQDPVLDSLIQEDVNAVRNLYHVWAPMVIAEESGSPNAMASPLSDPLVPSPPGAPVDRDGTVYFGTNLLEMTFQQSGGWGIPTIIGHEYAHILQFKKGFPRGVETKWKELDADFMAGFFTEHRARFRQQELQASAAQIFDVGDWEFNSPAHHGTPFERTDAFWAGVACNVRINVPDADRAYDESIAYLRSQGAPL